jgi:hypothetical protein
VVSLAPTPLEGRVADLLSPGAAPCGVLLDFLHETTHQWCFYSAVGYSIAYLQARALCLVALDARGATVGTRDVLDAAVRIETARELLRPLAEGLAMFIELDATTGKESTISSLPFEATPLLFGRQAYDELRGTTDDPPAFFTALLTSVLAQERLSDDALQRRLRLLTEPLAVTAESPGYLAGYLTVKHLLFASAAHGNAGFLLEESDLFACFLRAWIYRDYQLVHHLLTEDRLDLDTVLPIARHISERLHGFVGQADMQQDLSYFELATELRLYEATTLGRDAPPEFLHADADIYMSGVAAIQHLETYAAGTAMNEFDEINRRVQKTLMETRHYVDLAGAEAHLEVDKKGHARVLGDNGELLLETSVDPSWSGEGPGRVDVMYSTLASHTRQVVLTRGEHLLAVDILGLEHEDDDVRAGHVRRSMSTFSDVLRVRRFLWEAEPRLHAFLERPHVREAMADVRAQLSEMSNAIYRPLAFPQSSPGDDVNTLGMLGLPGAERDVLEGAALLGLANGSKVIVEDIPDLFESRGLSWAATKRWLEEAATTIGFPSLVLDPAGRPYTSL